MFSPTSPFHTTDLGVYLRRFGVTTLILTGYSTTGVVEGTLRDARDQDYDCVVVRDGCALSAYGPIAEHFRPRRHRLSASDYRQAMRHRFDTWQALTTFPTAA